MLAQDGDAPPKVSISTLKLTDFRNYRSLTLDFSPEAVVLTGENGAGKTNLLEAISFLTPGRGLRRASYADVARHGADGFAVHAAVDGPLGECDIGTGTTGNGESNDSGRRVRINRATTKSDALLDYLRVMWLTPSMDGLFTGPAGDRRRFLDRMVLAIDPAHGRRAMDFEKAMRGRNRLLGEDRRDESWIEAIETQMAETGVAIAVARRDFVDLLRNMTEQLPDNGPFPKADIMLTGTLENSADDRPAIELEETYRSALATFRDRDRAAGRTIEGPHRSDLQIRHRPKDMPASLCSTGEQKALLVGIVLAHARLVGRVSGMAPILLLDEIAAHLDTRRRAALFAILESLRCQTFMTGTDTSLFSDLHGSGQFLTVSDGTAVEAEPR